MDRFFAQNRLSSLIDGVLSSAEAREVERAIAKNPDLATEHAAIVKAVELMRCAGPVATPSGFQVRVMTEVEALPAPGGQMAMVQSAAKRVPMEAVALVALALVIGIVIVQRGSIPDETPSLAAVVRMPAPGPVAPLAPAAGEEAGGADSESVDTVPEMASKKPPPSRSSEDRYADNVPARVPENPGDPTRPSAYHILHGGDQVLFKIESLKDALGGRLVDGNGNTFIPHALTEASAFRRVFLVVPNRNAIRTHAKLLKLSGKMPLPVTTKFKWLRKGEALFMVEVQL